MDGIENMDQEPSLSVLVNRGAFLHARKIWQPFSSRAADRDLPEEKSLLAADKLDARG